MNKKGGLFELLSKIKAKPGLYLSHPSVCELFVFLVGYKTARRELGIEPTEQEIKFYQEFHQFIEKEYNLHTSNSWAKIIMLYCSDEKQGFERFYQLLDKFHSQNKEISQKEKIKSIH
ncbi:hypothetical protein C7H19_07590 [Aphanothece hegewaldii CCALA 016]|uniref:Uncharacterized protein n=1 Tax=Aphanothece hegewaldii CCALA 016 TaxID=2107694 RepID=A0A2T1LZJ4_9CHRO|nr:hypothetical protein [Aphanothece hegewaldii]PSF37838.1 hypothetical protein C7H19_07590 [Aphanothece hegewaldii CCALA 016]